MLHNATVHRTVRAARAVRAVLARPPYVVPGHFYSPLTSPADVNRALDWDNGPSVELSEARQLSLAAEMRQVLTETPPGPRYVADNNMFGVGDATVYRAMLHHLKPARIIEVGSGYSTAIALDECEASNLIKPRITCIEPYPERLLSLLRKGDEDRVTLIQRAVQETEKRMYDQLGPNDVLFIDSTHVAKAGSDVIWLFLNIMPRLAPGVVVHIHDVFWPFEYPADWLQEHRDWTEIYLLHAFLIGNKSWEIMLFPSWLWKCHPEIIPKRINGEQPGSIWLRRVH